MSTLSTTQLIQDVLDAFKVRFPMLNRIGTEFSTETARLGQTVKARITSLPTVRDYDAAAGYEANAANANDLSTDVDVTLNRHKHAPIRIDYLDQISTNRNLYDEAVGNLAFALGKEAFEHAMSLVVAANFSQSSIFTVASSDKDMLDDVKADMNAVGAAPIGRYGIVSSGVYSALEADARISSGHYHGQMTGGNAYGVLRGISGFEEIYEYPSMPSNSENLTGFFGDRSGIVMASRLPNDVEKLASSLGIPRIAKVEVFTDSGTGLSLMGITWQKAGVFDVYTTLVWIYGMAAGKQGGANGALADYGGHRLITA